MSPVLRAVFGWLVPGGAYLLRRRYLQFALFAVAVWAAFAAGLALHGGLAWPLPAELAGLDSFTALVYRAGALGKMPAGGPYLLARFLGVTGTLLGSRLHEFGTTLLIMAGLINILAVSSALESEKEGLRRCRTRSSLCSRPFCSRLRWRPPGIGPRANGSPSASACSPAAP